MKKRLFELYVETLGEARKRHAELEKHPEEIDRVLMDGAKRAREVAAETMREVRKVTGLVRGKG